MEVAVIGQAVVDPTLSGVNQTSIFRILKGHPYNIKLVQELNEDDFGRRFHFCETISERVMNNPHYLFHLCFSDECTFFLNGTVNRHNCRYWTDSRPQIFHGIHTLQPQKLNVWVGIYCDHLIGPFFIPGNLTGELYYQLLEEFIDPVITEIIENDPRYSENEVVFQQDGASPHFAQVRVFSDDHFPGRWIGRRGPTEWPPRSPDLSPLDFFLWDHLKSIIYKTEPADLNDL
ncbi:hypothetical protein HHI36_003419 [Cryptolaemus montrouzieri]|uniref:Transposase n=1 Tax=Cryptolaemus montrouzieri TaxID=559131 RepID=A0ABD2PDC2_9CUCU